MRFAGLRKYFSALFAKLVSEHGTPGRMAAAVGVGLVIGTFPAYGLHLAITIAIGTLLRLNRLVMYAAANVSNPLTAPFLIFASVQVGHLALHAAWLPLTIAGLEHVGAGRFLGDWIVGSLLVGGALGVLGAAITYAILERRRRRAAEPHAELFAAVGARYLPAGRFRAGYVRGKLRGDPVYRAILDRIPSGASVTDLGCGDGHAAVLLALAGCTVHAIDWDPAKIDRARAVSGGLAVDFTAADVRSAAVEPSDVVLLLDVLHYFPAADQDALLARAAAALRPGGLLLVRDVDAARGWRAAVTVLEERLLTSVRFHRAARLDFRPAAALAGVLERAGLAVETLPMWAGTPFANVLIAGRRAL